ncbi:MAG: hypothetical protein U1G07_07535 [Verrucomicrobiota bacterium]
MSEYVNLPDADKLKLLQEHSFQAPFPTLDQKNWCLHCEQEFDGHSTRVWKGRDGSLWLECGTPGCDGSPIDWAPYPWWDPKHPLTRKHERQTKGKQERHARSSRLKSQTG